jgi:hypothetical protein
VGSRTRPGKDRNCRSEADSIAIPYGIYDTQAKRGAVFVDTSHNVRDLFALADAGRSHGPGCRKWRKRLRTQSAHFSISSSWSAAIHGDSKWNPIDHGLFSQGRKGTQVHPYHQTPSGFTANAHLISEN